MRYYTNSENMEVEVDESHLQAAVELKMELQKDSFGGRCNWIRHKQMMEQSGFHDSDTNEPYRCLIKTYQKEINQLKSVDKYADFVADSKLQAIRKIVGELKTTKLETREENLIKSKLDRELTFKVMAVEEFRDICLDDLNITVPHYIHQPRIKNTGNVLKVNLADLHIGAKVDCYNNFYNLEVANKRIDLLIARVIDLGKVFGASTISVSLLGDLVENFAMRFTQSEDCEFNMAHQIIEARRIIFRFIVSLAEYFNVEVNAVTGNHDRLTPDKKQSYDGDNAVAVIMENIKDMVDLINTERIKVNLSDNGYKYVSEVINGVRVRIQHGDDDSINDSNKIQKYSGIDEIDYDVLIFGHLHHFDVRQDNGSKQVVYCSSLQGTNDYSRDKIKSSANAGQTVIFFGTEGQVYPINIDLQEVNN